MQDHPSSDQIPKVAEEFLALSKMVATPFMRPGAVEDGH
jgi:hypothetical protein